MGKYTNWATKRKAEIEASLSVAHAELEEVLTAARAGLSPTPTPGAVWNAETRYITGDTVEGGYVALKYNKGKSPADYLGVYWEIQRTTYQAWEDIEDGTVIEIGAVVTYGGKTWKCTEQHIKSTVYKPKAGSSKWSEYTD